ncbi:MULTISPECIES: IS1380 family transposase [Paenarthrobacter]|uniref:IS1380 family transposase n=1 Tax=Paenarthrobacter ureafaciens TaxID=37931 RepID=A0AAX3ER49_PAEUR|nr:MULTISPECIES: IS1380 family transposase [Paenarthrobacter]MDO5862909.1 IS1380 family transposase [Paenarthrobacter sp. SD-2]MDO5878110.1 IS1380 family transposase [Paenarthrobacter sp. SD-1]UYV93416.1 IS1380 family transposase [Paenarthrobacter ureafaciens]UYW00038.1 IS1380 family transposase [Paenarthrobacter ureafaciens]
MQFKHAPAAVSAVFDDPNLVSAAGLVPMLRLAQHAGVDRLAQARLTVPTDKGSNAGSKVMALVAGMVAGADSIDDMNVLRHGGMGRLFHRAYAPSTLGSFLREFTFGHVRQLDAVSSRVVQNLAGQTPLLRLRDGERVMVDLDDTIIEVHGYQKQGAGFGYSGVRGLNALIATASTSSSAPVILGQRLRQGKTGSPKGAARIVGDALATLRRMSLGNGARPLLRADSAFYGHATIGTAITAGADVSVTVRMDPAVKAAIATIAEDAWEMIEYPNAIRDESTGRWISKAEVAEVPFTAFRSRKKAERIEGRLVVRRIPDLGPTRVEQPTLFDVFRHHAFFTTTAKNAIGTVVADKTHRGHAIIEQVHADLKAGPLAHLPSGVFTANSAWFVLAVIAFNLTRAAGIIADRAGRLAKATTATIRRTLVTVPARLARSARRITLHLPSTWPWEAAFARLFAVTHAPPPSVAT